MFNKIKQLSKNALLKESLIYGLTNALYSGLPILIIPLLVKVLSPEDYGLVELYRNFSLILIPLLGMSTVQSVVRFYYDLENLEFKIFVSNIISLHCVTTILGLISLLSVSTFIRPVYSWLIGFSIVYFLFSQITEILLSIYRAEKSPPKYMMLRLTQVIFDIVLLAIFFFFLKSFDWSYRVYPNVLAAVLVGGISLVVLYKQGYFHKIEWRLLKMAIMFGAPLILHMVSGYILNIGDRFFILYFLTEKDLGNYTVMYQLGMLVNFLFTSFNLAWGPTFFEMMKAGNTKRIHKIKMISYLGIVFFNVVVIGFVYLLTKFTLLFEHYEINMGVIILVSISYAFISMYKFESNYYFFYKTTKQLSVITLGAAIITVVLNILLIPIMKLYGCAIATLVASLFMFILASRNSKANEEIVEKT